MMARQCFNHRKVNGELVRCRFTNGHWCPCEYVLPRVIPAEPVV